MLGLIPTPYTLAPIRGEKAKIKIFGRISKVWKNKGYLILYLKHTLNKLYRNFALISSFTELNNPKSFSLDSTETEAKKEVY